MILIVFFVVFLLSIWLQAIWSRRKHYKINDQIPGPPTYPIIGNMLDTWGLTTIGKFYLSIDIKLDIKKIGYQIITEKRIMFVRNVFFFDMLCQRDCYLMKNCKSAIYFIFLYGVFHLKSDIFCDFEILPRPFP
jgi:hypothetical protein